MKNQTPDSPCIGLCTTTYTDICSACGRTYIEVAQWNGMTEEEKQAIWIRINAEATAWRYNIYKNRVKT